MSISETLSAPSRHAAAAIEPPKLATATRRLRFGWLGWVGLAGVMGTGAVVAISAAGTSVLLPNSLRPLPGWLVGTFGRNGIDLGLGGSIGVLALMFVSYALVVAGADRLSPRAVLM
ncbi:MAG: hypothetical protein ACRDPA_17825, partial [Solirubrobacteraceae bacterium]